MFFVVLLGLLHVFVKVLNVLLILCDTIVIPVTTAATAAAATLTAQTTTAQTTTTIMKLTKLLFCKYLNTIANAYSSKHSQQYMTAE